MARVTSAELAYYRLCKRRRNANKELTDRIVELGLSGKLSAGGKMHGLVLDVGGYYKNVFTLAPSFYITEKEIDLGVDLFEEALSKALNKS